MNICIWRANLFGFYVKVCFDHKMPLNMLKIIIAMLRCYQGIAYGLGMLHQDCSVVGT